MSLLPYLLEDFHPFGPSYLLNEHLGTSFEPENIRARSIDRGNIPLRASLGYLRPWKSLTNEESTSSSWLVDKNKFQVNLDVQHFAPDEISVKVSGKDTITVEGKHEEKHDEHGFISRQFMRRYVLPEGHDIDKVESRLSSDGILSIVAPKVGELEENQERSIPIQQTGVPLIKNTPEENETEI